MKPKLGVVRFPGTNCDRDTWGAAEAMGFEPIWLWHEDRFEGKGVDRIIVPGGFSYGDYLRTGALAAKAPVMEGVRQAAEFGVPILGICNGFQILCESGLLPGALVQNESRRFVDEWTSLQLVNRNDFWGSHLEPDREVLLPIAHGDGRFYADEELLKKIEDTGRIWLRYGTNPNGSLQDIAGVMNDGGNVVGLMPHPERAIHDWMGGVDGVIFFN